MPWEKHPAEQSSNFAGLTLFRQLFGVGRQVNRGSLDHMDFRWSLYG